MNRIPTMDFFIILAENAEHEMAQYFSKVTLPSTANQIIDPELILLENKINTHTEERITNGYRDVEIFAKDPKRDYSKVPYSVAYMSIDGKLPCSAGMALCSFGIALLHYGVPVNTCILNYRNDIYKLWTAEKGHGAFLNEKFRLKTQEAEDFTNISAHITHQNKQGNLASVLANKFQQLQVKPFNTQSLLSIGCSVAAMKITTSIYGGTNPIETAILKPLVEEAGAVLTTITGLPINKFDGGHIEGHLIADAASHERILQII